MRELAERAGLALEALPHAVVAVLGGDELEGDVLAAAPGPRAVDGPDRPGADHVDDVEVTGGDAGGQRTGAPLRRAAGGIGELEGRFGPAGEPSLAELAALDVRLQGRARARVELGRAQLIQQARVRTAHRRTVAPAAGGGGSISAAGGRERANEGGFTPPQ